MEIKLKKFDQIVIKRWWDIPPPFFIVKKTDETSMIKGNHQN